MPLDIAVRSRNMWVIQKLKTRAAGFGIDPTAGIWKRITNNPVREEFHFGSYIKNYLCNNYLFY